MQIIELEGEDPMLYALTAHLVMNEKVLAYNLNYPFKTSPAFRWFVAAEDGKTLGFLPVKHGRGKVVLNNYYVAADHNAVFRALIEALLRSTPADMGVEAVVQTRHVEHFEQCGFRIETFWTRYVKMTSSRHGKERV